MDGWFDFKFNAKFKSILKLCLPNHLLGWQYSSSSIPRGAGFLPEAVSNLYNPLEDQAGQKVSGIRTLLAYSTESSTVFFRVKFTSLMCLSTVVFLGSSTFSCFVPISSKGHLQIWKNIYRNERPKNPPTPHQIHTVTPANSWRVLEFFCFVQVIFLPSKVFTVDPWNLPPEAQNLPPIHMQCKHVVVSLKCVNAKWYACGNQTVAGWHVWPIWDGKKIWKEMS